MTEVAQDLGDSEAEQLAGAKAAQDAMFKGQFAGRVVFVAGGGRNLGLAIASAFASAGASVGIAVRSNAAEGGAALEHLRNLGAKASLVIGDVARPEVCRQMVEQVGRDLGPIDTLIHAVGLRPHHLFHQIDDEEWRQVQETNCYSAFYLARAVLPSMQEGGFGRIVALGGVGPGRTRKHSHISVSKAGLAMMMSELAVEVGQYGITANTVSPGAMNTAGRKNYPSWPPTKAELADKQAIPRLGEPFEVAGACLFLASRSAGYISGQVLRVNGGREM